MSKTVLLEVKNGLGYLTINRPSALNALSSEVLKDLNLVLDQIEASEDIRVVIVTGQGKKHLSLEQTLKRWTKCLQFRLMNT